MSHPDFRPSQEDIEASDKARDYLYWRERADDAEVKVKRLQHAVDAAHGALLSTQLVGGLSERDGFREAFRELSAVATQHKGQPAGEAS